VCTHRYYYYLLASLKKEIWWKKYITRLQIIQFVLVNSLHSVSYASSPLRTRTHTHTHLCVLVTAGADTLHC
jgi:hypothetical protein